MPVVGWVTSSLGCVCCWLAHIWLGRYPQTLTAYESPGPHAAPKQAVRMLSRLGDMHCVVECNSYCGLQLWVRATYLLITISCVHRPVASIQAGHNPLPLTPGMGSVGSVTPRGLSSSSSDLDPLTGASGVGQGKPRSSLGSDMGSFDDSPARQLATDRLESDQENEPPLR